MPGFAVVDVGTLSRRWWRRCQPRTGPALAIGAVAGFLTIGGLAVGQFSPDTLILWTKYQAARGAASVGLSSMQITWPDEQGESRTTVEALLQTPGLDAWAEPVSNAIVHTIPPALLSGFLALLATLLWSVPRGLPEQIDEETPETVAAAFESSPAAAEPEPSPVAVEPEAPPVPAMAEEPLPVTLPYVPPPPEAYPRPLLHGTPSDPDAPPNPAAQEPRHARPPDASAAQPAIGPSPAGPAPAGKSGTSYESHWGLAELPFENVPDPKFYFPAPMHEEALHRLLYGVQTRKGAIMLTGEIGCGKTLLSRELGLHLSGQQYDVALIANPSFGVEDFLAEVLYQLGIESTKTKVRLLHLLNDRLHENYRKGKQTVIVVDEAQAIPDDQVFEELRLLLNFQLNDRFLLTLVLMGQPELTGRVAAIKQFAQRISIRYHLGYFSAEQTVQYIEFRLKAAKCAKPIFTAEALAAIFKQSGGVPRNINTLCDLCLLIGYMDRATGVDRKIVERATAERGEFGLS